MANYNAQMRSNYFRVQDERAFRQFCANYRLEVITQNAETKKEPPRFGFMIDEAIPDGHCDSNGEWVETDFLRELSRHLANGEVAVVLEIGSEKMRYLNGYACAVNSKGKRVEVSLSDIYRRAKETFGIEPTLAEY